MKVVALVLVGIVASVAAFPIDDEPLLKNGIEKLIKEVIEYFRWLLKRHDPYTPPDIPELKLVDDDVDVKISMSDVKVSDETNFSIDNVYFNLPNLQSTFQVTEPTIHAEGSYEVSGAVLKKKISGSGTFSVDITGFVQKGKIQYTIVDHNLQIVDIDLDYDLSGAKVNIDGLKIEGMSDDEVKKFIKEDLLNLAEQHKAALRKLAGNKVKELANQFLIGKNLNFMKQLIYSTPDPPPFPFIKQ